MKHDWGDGPISVYTVVNGIKDVAVAKRAIILPARTIRDVVQGVAAISANKAFVYGGSFDSRTRNFIIDRQDLNVATIKKDDWLVFEGCRYEIKTVQSIDVDNDDDDEVVVAWVVVAQQLLGVTPEQIFLRHADHLLNLIGVGTAVTASDGVNNAPSFSIGDGKVTTAIGTGHDQSYSVTVQADGKILVAGYTYSGSTNDFAVVRYNTDGTLDTTFDGDGKVTTTIGTGHDVGYSVTVQADGKILVAGGAIVGSANDFALVRYNTDGSLDTTFDGDGKVTTAIGSGHDLVFSVTVQADSKILVAGYTYNGSNNDFALVRYNTDGSLDTTFDGDGKVTTAIGTGHDYGQSVTVQADGKILVAGYAVVGGKNELTLVRYNTDGSLDTTFSGDGKVTTAIGIDNDYGYSVTVQADGKILVAGYTDNGSTNDFALVRYNTDGSLDTTFDGDGKVTTAIGTGHDVGYSVTVQTDGKILVAGYTDNGTNYDFALVRYNTDGSLDPTFSGDGKVITAIGAGHDQGRSVTVQADGKILVAGYTHNGSNYDFALVRYNTDGSLDIRFNLINTLGGTVGFTEGGSAVVLDSTVQVYDAELSPRDNFNGATLTLIRDSGTNSDDIFSATGTLSTLTQGGNLVVGGTAIGTVTTNSGGTLLLTFHINATQARVNSVMQQLAYSNSSSNPPASVQINWTFNDGNIGAQGSGGALTSTGITTINITPI
jgi:uncharacterized delta-60 repeat protein